MKWLKRNQLREIIKYGISGAITTGINLLLFYGFTQLGIYYLLANVTSYYIAVLLNFLLNYKYVFPNTTQKRTVAFIQFLGLRTVSLIVDTMLFFLLVSCLHFHVYGSRITLSIVIILINFIWSKIKIFR